MKTKTEKLLNNLNYISGNEKLIKIFKRRGYPQFGKVIDSWRKNINTLTEKDIDNLNESLEKTIKAFEKEEKLPVKFKKHYISSELIKLSQNLFETKKLNKKGRDTINVDFTEGEMEVEVWEGRNTNYYIKVADLPELKGKSPKMYVSQMKNFYLLMGLVQEQQYNNSNKEASCRFTLSEYAKRRGYSEEQIKKSGSYFNELKRDLISGAFINYKIKKLKLHGEFYTWLGNMYGAGKPDKPKGEWEINFNFPYNKMVLSVLEGEARPYFVKNPKAIEDRVTDNKPYLFLFYIQLTKRKQKILTTQPIKIKNLLEDMKLPEKILIRPKECFKVLKECLIYFSQNYPPVPEIESFNLYNDFHKTETVKLPLNISEAFKEYSYIDFKDLLKAIGIKDIREAYISFKRPYTKPKSKSKLSEEDKQLRDNILEWAEEWEKSENYTIEKSEEERCKYIDDRIRTLGYQSVNNLFEEEKNKKRPSAYRFLICTLAGREDLKEEDMDWDNYNA